MAGVPKYVVNSFKNVLTKMETNEQNQKKFCNLQGQNIPSFPEIKLYSF